MGLCWRQIRPPCADWLLSLHWVMKLWRERVAATCNAPPFAVWRLWLDRPVAPDRPFFLGTSGFGPLDNISVLERFEEGAERWAAAHGGSVVELHAYALTDVAGRAGAEGSTTGGAASDLSGAGASNHRGGGVAGE